MEKEIKTYNTYNNGNNSKINVHFTDGTQWTRTIAAYDATMAMREGLPYVRYLMQKYAAPQPRPERPRLTREEERLNQLIATSHIVPLSPDQQEEMAILEDRVNTPRPIYERIKQLRQERGITQTQLAEMIGIKQPSLARIESGRHTIRLDILERICEALGVSLNLE